MKQVICKVSPTRCLVLNPETVGLPSGLTEKSPKQKNGQNESKGSTEEFYYNVVSVDEKKYISDYQTSL